MEKLSVEVVTLILEEVLQQAKPANSMRLKPHVAPYATISRTWQHVVEARNFRFLQLELTEIDHLAAIAIAQPHRRAILRRIHLILAEPNAEAFRSGICSFARLLHEWDQNIPDANLPPLKVSMVGWAETWFDEERLAKVPPMRRVTFLHSNDGTQHGGIYPKVAFQIASLMPRLETLALQFREPSRPLEGRRQLRFEFRRQLGEALLEFQQKGLSPQLKHLELNRFGFGPLNHSFELENVLDDDGVDKLCEAIRVFSERSTTVEKLVLVNVLISPDLFRDRRPRYEIEQPTWPKIQQLYIRSNILTPSGEWLYTGSPEDVEPVWVRYYGSSVFDFDYFEEASDSEEEESENGDDGPNNSRRATDMNPHHFWRTQPDPGTLEPLLLELVDATNRMPNLQVGLFHLAPSRENSEGVLIQWAKPGVKYMERTEEDTENLERGIRRCKVDIGEETVWEPSWTVVNALRQWVGDGSVNIGHSLTDLI